MYTKSAIASTLLVLAATLPSTLASGPAPDVEPKTHILPKDESSAGIQARSFSSSQYQSLVQGNNWSDSWWDQNSCDVNQQADTWSWVITIENAHSVDGNNCGASYMNKIKSTCTGPLLAWACRYVGASGNTAYIDINADQSCTPDKVSAALGQANAAMTCGTYKDSFGAGVLEPMGTWKGDITWDFLGWW